MLGNTTKFDPAVAGKNFWLESCGDDLTPRAKLSASIDVDVAIMGGGFSGLWTAYYLLRKYPGTKVAIIEREICGYGASGRNGGWVSPRYPTSVKALVKLAGIDIARRTLLAHYATVQEIAEICAREGINADITHGGVLSIARGQGQLKSIQGSCADYATLGLADRNQLIDKGALRERVNVSGGSGALWTSVGATVHPGKLVRGLARVVERLGGQIFEGSAVTRIQPGGHLSTAEGAVSARRAAIIASEAYTSQLDGHHRALLPLSSTVIVTEPLSDDHWDKIGWRGQEGLSSLALTANYLTRTPDGRILYGSRGAPYLFGSRIEEHPTYNVELYDHLRKALVQWFPLLESTQITHAWNGYLGVRRDWAPSVHFDSHSRIGHLFGYAGRGVATSNLAARALTGQIMGEATGLEFLPMLKSSSRNWEPEPLRWIGVRYIQDAFQRIDDAENASRPQPMDTLLVKTLSGI
jgi:glycine/D-amino acid oxidase-like deaminating enzyme